MEKLLEMINKIDNKKAEIKKLVAENKIVEAKAAKAELEAMDKEFKDMVDKAQKDNILDGLDDDTYQNIVNKAREGKDLDDDGAQNNVKKYKNAFVNAIKSVFTKKALNEDDVEILDQMNEGTDADGGLTVPQDIQTKIKERRRAQDSLESLVNVETVSTLSGSRVIEKNADSVPFDNVDEAAEFPDADTPQFEKISYKIKKKGGILKLTKELIADTAENILAYLTKWITKKSIATRNALILKQFDAITKDKEKTIASLDDIKDIYNVELDPAIAETAVCITNQQGFNWLDKLKDKDGKYILQYDPAQASKKLLFGQYPVKVLSKKVLKSTDVMSTVSGHTTEVASHKYPFYFGDPKEAVTIFDREQMTIDINDRGDGYWEKDLTGVKVRERLDIQTVDSDAIIKGFVTESVSA